MESFNKTHATKNVFLSVLLYSFAITAHFHCSTFAEDDFFASSATFHFFTSMHRFRCAAWRAVDVARNVANRIPFRVYSMGRVYVCLYASKSQRENEQVQFLCIGIVCSKLCKWWWFFFLLCVVLHFIVGTFAQLLLSKFRAQVIHSIIKNALAHRERADWRHSHT